MNYYLDYENTHQAGFKGLEYLGRNDTVYIFYSSHAPSAPRYYERIIRQNNINIETRRLFQIGKNGLDFYIASQVGADVKQNSQMAIISGDNGYKAVQDYWGRIAPIKADVYLGETIETVLMQCDSALGDYVRSSTEMLPIESFKNHAPDIKKEEIAEPSKDTELIKIERPPKDETEDVARDEIKDEDISALVDILLHENAKKCYTKCITLFGERAADVYNRVKIEAMPKMISNTDYFEILDVMDSSGSAAAERLCRKKYGRTLSKPALRYMEEEYNKKPPKPEIITSPLPQTIEIIDEDEGLPPEDQLKNFDMYGSVEAIGIAGCILSLTNDKDEISASEVIETLSGSPQKNITNYYYGVFRGLKHADIKIAVLRLSKTGCFTIRNDIIDNLDKELLKSFENPISNAFRENKDYHEFNDIDWIDFMHCGTTLRTEDWAKIIPMFNRVFLLSMFREDICGFIRRAPKGFMKKLTLMGKRSSGAKASLISQLLSQVGKAA